MLHIKVALHGLDKHSSISIHKMYSSKQLIIINIMYIPLQLLPLSSNSYPLLHEHVKEPSVLVQLWSHGSSVHSSLSKIQLIYYLYNHYGYSIIPIQVILSISNWYPGVQKQVSVPLIIVQPSEQLLLIVQLTVAIYTCKMKEEILKFKMAWWWKIYILMYS